MWVAGCLCAALLGPSIAGAQGAAAPSMYEGFNGTPCEADFLEHCSFRGTKSKAYTCLRELFKRDGLRPVCAAHTEKLQRERHAAAVKRQNAWMEACAEDIPKFCSEHTGARAMTIKGCLGKKRAELSEACNAKLPIRSISASAQKGTAARARWRDGSEPEDWALQNALLDTPRKTKEEIDEIGRDAWIAREKANRAQKRLNGEAARAATQAAAQAAATQAAAEAAAAQAAAEAAAAAEE